MPPGARGTVQTFKGSVFVLAVAGLAYVLVRSVRSDIGDVVRRLAESRARLQRTQSIARIGGWELDLATGEMTWGRRVHEIFGTSARLVRPSFDAFLDRVHPEDRSRFEAAGEATLAGEGPLDLEHRVVLDDGEVRWVHQRAELNREAGRAGRLSGTCRDVTERRRLQEELEHRALHDSLTDLPNRSLLLDRLAETVERLDAASAPVALLMLDLTRFKDVNESLGHTAGDRILQEVARRLEACVGGDDTVARMGGDEFAILVEPVDGLEGVEALLGRIDDALDEPMSVSDETVRLRCRVGAVLHDPGASDPSSAVGDPLDLARYADLAIRRARDKGRHHVYSPPEDRRLAGRLRREQRLRRAIEEDEFVVHYQPVVHLEDGSVWGLEPLARWEHPEEGLLGPGVFIPLAEDSGLIQPLGAELLRTACRQVSEWNRRGVTGAPLRLSPNVSARQLEQIELAGVVGDILEEESLEPSLLQLEITETAILRASHGLRALKERGIHVAIDDFGTGYASFTYLRDLEIDALKIDMSFVQGAASSEGDRAICRTVVGLADAFGLSVIAEGIESREQRDTLRRIGCGIGQGFLFARPTPPEELPGLLSNGGLASVAAGAEA